jgi:hypothetical protein
MKAAPIQTSRGTLLGWSASAAIAAGVLVLALVVAAGFVGEGSRYGWSNDLLGFWGVALWVVALGGLVFGLVMTVPVYLASLWAVPRKMGAAFAIGAVATLILGFGMLSLATDAAFAIFRGALVAATGLGGVFFVTRIERWTWTEPCAS